jgi:hypothetical protein
MNNRAIRSESESSIPIANRGGVPNYPESEGLQERLARCIEHELYYGGNHEAAAAAIIRDVNLGYINQLTSSDNATPTTGEKAELVAWLRENANDERDIENGGTIAAANILDRIGDILENTNEYYFLPKPTDRSPLCIPTPISVNDRLPGPEDCDERKYVWVYEGKHCPSYYTKPWRFQEIPTPSVSNWFWRNVTHWLPYYAIQIPTYTETTNET